MIIDSNGFSLNSQDDEDFERMKSIYAGNPESSWLEDIDRQQPGAIDTFFLEQQILSRKYSGQEFLIRDFPNIWPLNTLKLTYQFLPQHLKDSLSNTKVGYVNLTPVLNAQAWSSLNKVYLYNGLSTSLLEAMYCTIPDKREYMNRSIQYPPQIFEYAHQIKKSSIGVVAEKASGQNRNKLYDSLFAFYSWRKKLSDDFPDYRQAIESFAAGPANSLVIFTFLHELGHVFLNHEPYSHDIKRNHTIEYSADAYALEIYFQMLDYQQEFATLSHIAFAGLLMSVLEFFERLSGTPFDVVMENNSNIHPRHMDRRMMIFDRIGEFFRGKPLLKEKLIPEIDYAYSTHIYLSDVLSRLGFGPLTPFFTKDDVREFHFRMPPHHAYNAANETVQAVENVPYKN